MNECDWLILSIITFPITKGCVDLCKQFLERFLYIFSFKIFLLVCTYILLVTRSTTYGKDYIIGMFYYDLFFFTP